MKNKILSLVLALLMAASSASAVLANDDVALIDETAEEAAVVEEVEDGQYNKAIEFLATYGIMKGITDNDFGAELDVQRYQMALFVSRISTGWINDHQWLKAPENWTAFTDISEGPAANYWGALSYASQAGIIEGYGDGKFGPEDQITYQNALTMVVRTLGYTGLDWPWGYIQKAVELGLTEGITGVSYTDNLTRGEVAQIIYNAMFAKMKDGSSLAVKNFGIEFGWEKVIVTASDLNTFVADKKDAKKDLNAEKTETVYKNSNKPSKGFVTFQILKDDGSLADDVYYVQASELGLKGDHDDEAAVGEAYYVLFEKDEDGLAKVVAYESLKLDTIVNAGKTDDDAEEQDYAIQEFLEDYALVGKYTTNEYLNVTKSTDDEIMVFGSTGVITEEYINGNLVAIDWETGDILVPQDQNDDDKITEDDKVDGEYVYDVEWNYNDVTGKYWRYTYDKKYEHVIGIDKMTEKEFSDTYAKYFTTDKNTYEGFATTVDKIATSAYASLEIFDTDLNGVADRGIYESYRLGYFYEDKASDSKSYRIDALDAFDISKDAAKVVDGSVTDIANFNTIQEGIADKDVADRAWFVEGYEPNVKYDADGEAVGYESAYVVYNYDAETGAIKVVKVIDGSDEDSFVKTGVLRAYNLTAGTITIGEDTYHVNNYNELEGNPFKYVTEKFATKTLYTAKLRGLFNQFVQYVVVDGELVEVKAVKGSTSAVIVVDSYAGLSSDGYILVKGYHTGADELKYDTFRIGSYDGWEKGDYYYWLDDETAKESFTKGAIYTIGSYDETEDVYYVNLAGKFTWVRGNGDTTFADKALAYEVEEGVALNHVTISADNSGYLTYKTYKADGTVDKTYEDVKAKDGDKYVIIEKAIDGAPYAPVIVYNGKLPAGWSVTGDRINSSDRTNKTYVIVNATINNGFKDEYKAGFAVVLDGAYLSADYNGATAEKWYALGSVEYVVGAVDLLTGNLEATVAGSNIKVEEGNIYHTQSGYITDDLGVFGADMNAQGLVHRINDAYGDKDTYFAEYIPSLAAKYYTGDNYKDDLEKDYISVVLEGAKKDRNRIDEVKFRVIEFNEDNEVEDIYAIDRDKIDKNVIKANDITVLPAFYVYEVDSTDMVVYLVVSEATVVTSTDEIVDADKFTVVELEDAKIVGQVIYKDVTTTVCGVSNTVRNVLGIRYTFEGEAVEGIHAKILANGYHFGTKGDHIDEQYTVQYNYDFKGERLGTETVYGTIVAVEYADCNKADADCDGCDLVKAIDVRFKEADVIEVNFTAKGDVKYHSVDAYTIYNKVLVGDTVVFYAKVSNDVENWNDATNEKYVDGVAADNCEFEAAGMSNLLGDFTGVSTDSVVDGLVDLLD